MRTWMAVGLCTIAAAAGGAYAPAASAQEDLDVTMEVLDDISDVDGMLMSIEDSDEEHGDDAMSREERDEDLRREDRADRDADADREPREDLEDDDDFDHREGVDDDADEESEGEIEDHDIEDHEHDRDGDVDGEDDDLEDGADEGDR